MLTHYTRSPEALVNMLAHGFAWIPNKRNLTSLLIPMHDFAKREPQQFGMISFTDLWPEEAADHAAKFGCYGIMVTGEWAGRNAALPVIYVNDYGPATEAWKALFELGYNEVCNGIQFPDDGFWQRAFENKIVAAGIARSRLWANLLQLWEYMEPAANFDQREYRVVNPDPYYSLSTDKKVAIAKVSPPMAWAKHMHVLSFGRSDVVMLVCPAGQRRRLRRKLPAEYRAIRIVEIGTAKSWIARASAASGAAAGIAYLLSILSPSVVPLLFPAACGLAVASLIVARRVHTQRHY